MFPRLHLDCLADVMSSCIWIVLGLLIVFMGVFGFKYEALPTAFVDHLDGVSGVVPRAGC